MNKKLSVSKVQRLTVLALMTALVVLLYFTLTVKFGQFQANMVLVPVVVGSAMLGPLAGGWLGLVSAVLILLSGDAALFFSFGVLPTILVVIVKGVASGMIAGVVFKAIYKLFQKRDKEKSGAWVASVAASITCPVVNTGIFFLGSLAFFLEPISAMASEAEFSGSTAMFIIVGFISMNFVLELIISIVLSPVIRYVVDIANKMFGKKLSAKMA